MFLRSIMLLFLLGASVGYADLSLPIPGSTYFIAPGAGTPSGFQVAGGPYLNSTIDGLPEVIGPDISGNGMVLSTDTLINNFGRNYDLILRVETVGGNLMPMGIIGDSGVELTTLGIFIGAGIDAVETNGPLFANTAEIEVFNLAGSSLGLIDVIGLGNFNSGIGGGWDGSLGLNFGNLIPIGDVGAIEFRVNFDSIPEPSAAGLIGIAAIVQIIFGRRRRI